jgi:hypothetical protein
LWGYVGNGRIGPYREVVQTKEGRSPSTLGPRPNPFIFIDENGCDVELSLAGDGPRARGILVVLCGNLTVQEEEFDGVLPVLDGEAGTSERCGPGEGKSSYRSERAGVKGYVYAEEHAGRRGNIHRRRLYNRGSPRAGKRIC